MTYDFLSDILTMEICSGNGYQETGDDGIALGIHSVISSLFHVITLNRN